MMKKMEVNIYWCLVSEQDEEDDKSVKGNTVLSLSGKKDDVKSFRW